MEVILASKSPRRSQLLNQINISHIVLPPNINEKLDENLSPEEFVRKIALIKARTISKRKKGIIIGADTIVYSDKIFGKPLNKEDARKILLKLSDRIHYVYTGLAIIKNINQYQEISGFEKTAIKMRKISNEEIERYISTNEPYDAAGAYKIQGLASIFIEKIDGCYFNVMGFPIFKFYTLLNNLNIDIWKLMVKSDQNENRNSPI